MANVWCAMGQRAIQRDFKLKGGGGEDWGGGGVEKTKQT